MFFLDKFMDFIYKHPLLRKSLLYIFYTVISFVIVIIILLYLDTGKLIFDTNILFNMQVYRELLEHHKNIIYTFIILEQILFIAVLLWQNYKLDSKANCSVQYINIEDIASIWLEYQTVKKEDTINNEDIEYDIDKKPKIVFVEFKLERTKKLYNDIIIPHISKITEEELLIIIDLLKIQEEVGYGIPSVISPIEKDPEIKYKKDILTQDGMNSYEILRKVNLYEHSLNVVDFIYKGLKAHSKTNYVLLLGKAIIAALAHDLGKIRKFEEKLQNISQEIFSSQPHHQISKIFFSSMYPDYTNKKIVVEAIKEHHDIKIDKKNDLVKLLVEADKRAREYEIEQYFKSNGGKKITKTNNQSESEIEENKDLVSKCHLTKAFTRATYDNEVEQYFKDNKDTLALVLVDVDDFKLINDKYENYSGDRVLQNLVEITNDNIKDYSGKVYRYGGNEFLILFPNIQKEELTSVLDILKIKIENTELNVNEKSIKYTISIGVAFSKYYNNKEELEKKSEEALSQAKKQGKNRVVFAGILDKDDNKDKKIPKELSDDIDIDIDEPFADIMVDKKSNKLSSKNNDEYDSTYESFNIDEYENKILEELKSKINIVEPRGFKLYYYSISYNDMILFNFSTLVKAIESVVGFKKECKKNAIYFIREYRKRGNIGYIDIENNYVTSKFYIEDDGVRFEYDAVPIFAKVFNMDKDELNKLKMSNSFIKEVKVLTSKEIS